jgi:hypothetical protein
MKPFDKTHVIQGKNIVMRAATPTDAEFVYELRTTDEKTRYLNRIEGTVDDQRLWLERSYADPSQFYFVIESKSGERLGLFRIQVLDEDRFGMGSWIMRPGVSAMAVVESYVLTLHFAVATMDFTSSRFDVRLGNEKVIRFHRRMGARELRRTKTDAYFAMDHDSIQAVLHRFAEYLPDRQASAT